MRRFTALILAAVMLLSLSACGGTKDESDTRPRVVTTIFPQYDFVRAVAGDRVSLSMLVSPGSESHTYEPSIADVAAVAEADLFIYTGGDIDPWAEALSETVSGADVVSISITDAVEGIEHEHADGEIHGEEHVWTSPSNAILILDYITDALAELDPDGEDIYRTCADAYRKRLSAIGDDMEALADAAMGKTIVVADRFPFESLFEEYGLLHAEALGGCAVGEEPSASVIGEMCGLVEEQGIKYVFYIEFSDRKIADLISEVTGCGELLLHSCHNVEREDFDAGVTFCDLMERNVSNLREAIGNGTD